MFWGDVLKLACLYDDLSERFMYLTIYPAQPPSCYTSDSGSRPKASI